jgi:hypothetical protein
MVDSDLRPATRGQVEQKLKAIGECALYHSHYSIPPPPPPPPPPHTHTHRRPPFWTYNPRPLNPLFF